MTFLHRSCLLGLTAALIAAPAFAAEVQTIERAMAQAYQTNPGLQAERAKLRAVDEQVSQALSGWRPSVDAFGGVGKTYSSTGSNSGKTSTSRNVGAQVVQPVFQGFRTVAAVDAAEAQVKAQRALLQSAEQQLLLDAGTAYLDVVAAQAVLDLTRGNEEVLRRQLDATRDRYSVGEVTQTDVSQAESRAERTTAQRIQAEGDLANRRATYARLIGDMPGTLEPPNLVLNDLKDMDEVVRRAETRNPGVLAAQYSQDAAKGNITAARGSLLPEVNLVGSASRGWESSAALPDRQDSAQILAEVTVPLYRSGADYSRTRAAQQTATQLRLQLEDTRRRAREAAINAWQALTTTQAAIKSDKAGVEAAELALRGVREESNVGTRTVLDVLNAEQELLDAKVTLVRARRDEAAAILQTKAAVGELTAASLRLAVDVYDPQKHYDSVRDTWAGFGDSAD